MHHPTDRITHTTAFVTPVVEHWLLCHSFQTVCTVYLLFLASVHRGIPFDIIFYFIVETLNYANIMSRLDSLFITSKCGKQKQKNGRKEMFYFTTHSTHFIYGYMASDIW